MSADDSEPEMDLNALLERFVNKPGDTLDPRLVAEAEKALSEEELIGMHATEGGDNEKLPLVEGWFPNDDQWQGKTKVNFFQARALAVSKHLPEAFHEIDELDTFIDSVINDYEMLLTSVDGISREQQMNVLMSLFGKDPTEETGTLGTMVRMIAGGEEDND